MRLKPHRIRNFYLVLETMYLLNWQLEQNYNTRAEEKRVSPGLELNRPPLHPAPTPLTVTQANHYLLSFAPLSHDSLQCQPYDTTGVWPMNCNFREETAEASASLFPALWGHITYIIKMHLLRTP